MKTRNTLLISSLLVCLFIYVFYRTEKTVVNKLLLEVITFDTFSRWRLWIRSALPLPGIVIYSLPEGLWVLCTTLTSKSFIVHLGKYVVPLSCAPLAFAVGLELFQLVHLSPGRFDLLDIVVSFSCWAIALCVGTSGREGNKFWQPFTKSGILCTASYLIVYLAHVWI